MDDFKDFFRYLTESVFGLIIITVLVSIGAILALSMTGLLH